MKTPSPDPVWESEIYSQGRHLNLYPFDAVVSFLFRWRPRDKPRGETRILEIGCGAGNNLWFASREGFRVAGIDGSESAISFARERFAAENLEGDLRVGNFLNLPWENQSFDIGIDRGALVCVGHEAQQAAVAEMQRVLRPGGLFFFNGYSDEDTSAKSGDRLEDGRISNIRAGVLTGVGALAFNSKEQIDAIFANGWEVLKIEHMRTEDFTANGTVIHSLWRVVAQRI